MKWKRMCQEGACPQHDDGGSGTVQSTVAMDAADLQKEALMARLTPQPFPLITQLACLALVALTACDAPGPEAVDEVAHTPPANTRAVKVDEIRRGDETIEYFVFDDGSAAAAELFDHPETPAEDGVETLTQALYYSNCWAPRRGGAWREDGANDWDYFALFGVRGGTGYRVYASAVLWAAARATGDWPLANGRDAGQDRVWVNLGSNGRYAYWSVWVRTWC